MRFHVAATVLSSATLWENAVEASHRRQLLHNNRNKAPAFPFLKHKTADHGSAAKKQAPQSASVLIECDPAAAGAKAAPIPAHDDVDGDDAGLLEEDAAPADASAACPEDQHCRPSDQSELGGICEAAESSRELQTVNLDDYTRDVFDRFCSPGGARYGDCTNCPSDDANFDPLQSAISLTCAGPCASTLNVDFAIASVFDPETNVTYTATSGPQFLAQSNCSSAQKGLYNLCQGLASDSACDCPPNWQELDVDTEEATVVCRDPDNECLQENVLFPGDGTTGRTTTVREYCLDEFVHVCSIPTCDCSDLTVQESTIDGSVTCTLYGCTELIYPVSNALVGDVNESNIPEVPCVAPLYQLCRDCSCSGIDQVTGTGSGVCESRCGDYKFTVQDGNVVDRESTYCGDSEFGPLCFSHTIDEYTCPTLNGVPCTCEPTDCERLSYYGVGEGLFSFTFECFNGVNRSSCGGIFNDATTMCGQDVFYEACYAYPPRCDCSEVELSFGFFTTPYVGKVHCPGSCTESIEFFGDYYTTKREVCHTIYGQPGVEKICEMFPHPADGTCAVSLDGSPCTQCRTVACSPFAPSPFDTGTYFVCMNTTTGDSFQANTCYVSSCPVDTYMPTFAPSAVPTIAPSAAPSMAESMSPTMTPSMAPSSGSIMNPTAGSTSNPVVNPTASVAETSRPTEASGASNLSMQSLTGVLATAGVAVAIVGM